MFTDQTMEGQAGGNDGQVRVRSLLMNCQICRQFATRFVFCTSALMFAFPQIMNLYCKHITFRDRL